MHVLGFKTPNLLWAFPLLALLPGAGEAQLRSVVSNEIAVSGTEATLSLDFDDQPTLTIALSGGQVLVDDELVGSYTRGDALDLAWRSLLGDVISLDDGPLAEALTSWSPPEDLPGSALDVAEAVDVALEEALTLPEAAEDLEPGVEISLSLTDESAILEALLKRSGALRGLAEAFESTTPDQFILRVGESIRVEVGEVLDQSLVLVDGDLELRGTIDGDVVVTHGTVRLREGGLITGDLRVVDGEVESLGGEVSGALLTSSLEDAVALDTRDLRQLRKEMEKEIRRDLRASLESERKSSSHSFWNPFRNVGRAIGGLLENLVTLLILAVLSMVIVHFGRERLEVVATTVRRAPAQSAMVGLAGGFLLIPVWVLGIVALAVSIIGIPVLLAWVPLFPIAVGVAALLGYVAIARNVGEWVADQEYRGLEWIRGSNTFYVVLTGLGALMLPAIVASLVRILGVGLLQGLLGFIGSSITFIALAIGFGAVLLTRGGRIRPYAAYYEYEEELWAEDQGASPEDSPAEEGPGGAEPKEEGKPPTESEDKGGEPDA
jgi:hypothetical protein